MILSHRKHICNKIGWFLKRTGRSLNGAVQYNWPKYHSYCNRIQAILRASRRHLMISPCCQISLITTVNHMEETIVFTDLKYRKKGVNYLYVFVWNCCILYKNLKFNLFGSHSNFAHSIPTFAFSRCMTYGWGASAVPAFPLRCCFLVPSLLQICQTLLQAPYCYLRELPKHSWMCAR